MSQMQTKAITGNGQVFLGDGRIFRSALLSPGSAAALMTVYDGTDNTGPVLATLVASASGYSVVTPDVMINVTKGIYAEISGTGVKGNVYFE